MWMLCQTRLIVRKKHLFLGSQQMDVAGACVDFAAPTHAAYGVWLGLCLFSPWLSTKASASGHANGLGGAVHPGLRGFLSSVYDDCRNGCTCVYAYYVVWASGCRHWLPLLTGQFNYYSCCLVHHQHSMWRGGEVYPSHTLLYRSHVSGVCPKSLLWLVKGQSGEALTRKSSSQ